MARHIVKIGKGKRYISQKCFNCGAGEESRVLMPIRKEGESLWVCTRCLPSLIHGNEECGKWKE